MFESSLESHFMYHVTHCICHDKRIDDIVTAAREKKLTTLDEIIAQIGCADKCGLCAPYIEEKLSSRSSLG